MNLCYVILSMFNVYNIIRRCLDYAWTLSSIFFSFFLFYFIHFYLFISIYLFIYFVVR